ncbi:amidohydrolase [Gemmatirosa kalamazoonensis]|uniref:Amidohydrolase n=1 Tax=Gemmatirosa kalamazoonensis TaxID=861299 RepID=W0RJC1_9BACT|nr:amidohydrolase family protein [Gemmatirosa kalamazoonensis]AHG90871.1 amidohydrolase [Gemmatirosa kalamazoonensis]
MPNATRRTSRAIALATLLAASPLGAQTVAITGATIHPVSGPRIENGTIVITNGKIAAVGANVAVPAGAQRIDAAGKVVTPGLINSGTQLGLVDIGANGDTRDVNARGRDQIAAAFTIWEGLNPANVLIPPARADGITSVVVAPGNGLIAGQAAFVDLVGTTVTEMVRKAPVGMVAQVGSAAGAGVGARGELLLKLRELLGDARDYRRRRAQFESNQTRTYLASRADLEALQPVLAGTEPLIVQADRASDIQAVLRLGREFGLRLVIAGGAEAWEVAQDLAAAKVPVLTGAMNNIPDSFASLGQRQENAGLLAKAGVNVALVGNAGGGDEELFNVRNVRYEAGNAVSYGMAWEQALRAVTLTPAEIFGVADRVGALKAGMDANLVVWSGDPFEFATRAEHVFIRGVEHSEPTRQDLLIQRYRTVPPSYYRP